jgi:hypothetical protein
VSTSGTDIYSPYPRRTGSTGITAVEDTTSGWLYFAGTVLGLAGLMRIVDAIWAFHYHGAVPVNLQDSLFGSNLSNYGWVWLVVGVLLLVSSFLVVFNSQFGRWVGIIAAFIGALSAVTWLAYYPVWSMVYILTSVLVLYALIAHGGRTAA